MKSIKTKKLDQLGLYLVEGCKSSSDLVYAGGVYYTTEQFEVLLDEKQDSGWYLTPSGLEILKNIGYKEG